MLTFEGSLDSIVEFKSTFGFSSGGLISVEPDTGLVVALSKVGFVVEVTVVMVVVEPRVDEVVDAEDGVVVVAERNQHNKSIDFNAQFSRAL